MMFKMFPYLGFTRKWGRISTQDFAGHFKNPFLREAFSVAFAADIPDMPMIAMLMTLAWLHQKMAGYPLRGALEFARAIERGYLDLGGEIHYKSRVIKILVENDKATGVQPADGTEHRSHIVISAADGHSTIFDMLDGKYINDKIKGYYDNLPLFPPKGLTCQDCYNPVIGKLINTG